MAHDLPDPEPVRAAPIKLGMKMIATPISDAGRMPAGDPTPKLDAARRALRSRYAANLRALYAEHPRLALELEQVPFAAVPALEPTRDGNWTAKLVTDDGNAAYAHSKYKPLDEAQRLASALPERDTPGFAVCGIGLGYTLVALEQRFRRPMLVVIEQDRALIKAAMCVVDLVPIIEEGRLIFICDAEKEAVHAQLEPRNTDVMLGMHFVRPPLANRRQRTFVDAACQQITDYFAYGRMQIVTLMQIGRRTVENLLLNTPTYLRSPGIGPLKDRARGRPAIVVAAGPSLARNVAGLPALKDNAVLIAVQTTLQGLLQRGVEPHFATSLDYHDVSARFFENLGDFGRTQLVMEPKGASRVADTFPGRILMPMHATYQRLLGKLAPSRRGIASGATVAQLAFYLAEHLGCDPIIFVGLDLSFTEAMYYAPGTVIEQAWQPELSRFGSVEMKQWERIARFKRSLRPVTDINGRPAYTDENFFTYAERFAADFARTDRHVIQASEGGVAIPGMEVMSLAQVSERYLSDPLPSDLFDLPGQQTSELDFAPHRAEIETRAREIRDIREIARQTRAVLKKLEQLVDAPREFNRQIARIDDLRTRMSRHTTTYELLMQVCQEANFRRHSVDRQLGESSTETRQSAPERLRSDIEFVEAMIEGADLLLTLLPRVIARLEASDA